MEIHQLYNYSEPIVGTHYATPLDIVYFKNVIFSEAYSQSSQSVKDILDAFPLTNQRDHQFVTVEVSISEWETLNIHPFGVGREEIGHYWFESAPEIPLTKQTLNLTGVDSVTEFNAVVDIKETKTLHDNCMMITGRFHLVKPAMASLVVKVVETDIFS